MRKRSSGFAILLICALLLFALLVAPLLTGCGGDEGNDELSKSTENSSGDEGDASEPVEVDPGDTSTGTETGMSKGKQALEQAKVEGKPVLLNFHSTKCASCIQIEENIGKISPEYEGRVAFIAVDVYNPPENDFCVEYGIQTIPTTFFVQKDGTIMKKQVGVIEPDQLRQELNTLLSS